MFTTAFRTAIRHLLKNKMVPFLNISGISIGVATCLTIVIWAEREWSFDDFHPNVESKYRIWNTFKSESETFSQAPSGIALGAQLPHHIPAIKSACRVFYGSAKVSYQDKTFFEQRSCIVDSSFFNFFGFKLLVGDAQRLLRTPNEVVITESMARKYFGSVEEAMNKVILMDNDPMNVSGISADPPLNSHIQFDFLVPYARLHKIALEQYKTDFSDAWVGGWPHTYVEIIDASKKIDVELLVNEVVARFSKKDWEENKMSYQYFMQPVRDIHLQSSLRYDSRNNGSLVTVRVFISVAVFILLLACINYINLMTATALQRSKEISLRKVAGATRRQLMRQFFVETFVVTSTSVVLALLILLGSLPGLSAWMGQVYELSFTLSSVLILFGFVLTLSLLSGFYPAIVLSSFQPITALRGRFAQSSAGRNARKTLVVLQFAISTVLLISILVVGQQMTFIRNMPIGYNADAVITVDFDGDQSVQKNYQAIRNELLGVAHITSVTRHSGTTVGGLGNGWITTRNNEGKEVTTSIYRLGVDADYFETYGMELVAGRSFESGTEDSTRSVMINEATVKNVGWPSAQEAIGKPFGSGDNTRYVIGVVKDFHFESLHKRVEPVLIGHVRGGSSISLRVERSHIREGIDHLTQVWSKLVPGVPLQYSFIDELLEKQYAAEQKMASIFYIFAGISFLIACMGLFGLSTFMIQQRVREIGIRKVLGAQVAGIVFLLTTNFSKLVVISTLVAIPFGWFAMKKWLETFAYHTTISWWTYALAVAIPVLIAVATVSFHSIKAGLVNPAKTLRSE
ncbi:MAG TPA: ABC transporter permease [Cyclobacteriaceae bacterium]|nr:ABC transporter permease [Cyclobacteriaceae bacterium]